MANLDIDGAIAQLTELLEQIFKFLLKRAVGALWSGCRSGSESNLIA